MANRGPLSGLLLQGHQTQNDQPIGHVVCRQHPLLITGFYKIAIGVEMLIAGHYEVRPLKQRTFFGKRLNQTF